MIMTELKKAIVDHIRNSDRGVQEVDLIMDHRENIGLNYINLNGPLKIGDRVIVNTTAGTLGLGTGGYHFIVAKFGDDIPKYIPKGQGMKLKYLPCQANVLFAEEENNSTHSLFLKKLCLQGKSIFIGELHSMLLPLCAHLKYKTESKIKIAAIITDHGALPLWLSKNVSLLKDLNLLDATITIGNALGGDYECVNIYTGLQLAANILNVDAIIITMGPGIMGTGTPFGFSGLELGFYLDFCITQNAKTLQIPRLSFKDLRSRHFGLSHHFLNILEYITQNSTSIILPHMKKDKLKFVIEQLRVRDLLNKHRLSICRGHDIIKSLDYYRLDPTTMGRTIKEDPNFFYGIGAVAEYSLKAQ